MGKNISIDENTEMLIKEKATILGLSFSAFIRLAALTFEVKGAPSVHYDSEAPEPPKRDSNDQ